MSENSEVQVAPGIVTHPGRCGGEPTVKGTRVPVRLIKQRADWGQSVGEMLDCWPHLSRMDIENALAFARTRIPDSDVPAYPETP